MPNLNLGKLRINLDEAQIHINYAKNGLIMFVESNKEINNKITILELLK